MKKSSNFAIVQWNERPPARSLILILVCWQHVFITLTMPPLITLLSA